MNKKIGCLFLALSVSVSSTFLAYAEDVNKTQLTGVDAKYYTAVEQLSANGCTKRSSTCLIESNGNKLAIDLGMLDKDSDLSLSQLSAKALILDQKNADRAVKAQEKQAKKQAKAASDKALLKKYDGVKVTCDDWLNIRSKPSTDSKIKATMDAGKVARLKGISGDWYKIDFCGHKGYVSADYCKLVHYKNYKDTDAVLEYVPVAAPAGDDYSYSSGPVAPFSGGNAVVNYGYSYLGTPYVYGGASRSGTDCSGFTMQVFGHYGISLPHSVSGQFARGTHVSRSQLQPGDLVVFATCGNTYGHVGIYAGGGQFIHAGSSTGVTVSSLSESYWAARYVGGTRVSG